MPAAKRTRPRAGNQLPPGRHGLPRTFVASNQRERILSAVAEVVSGGGYSAVSVEDVIAAAGVSRRTFYDHFANKEEAFLAAYDEAVSQLRAVIMEAFAAAPGFAEGLHDCVVALAQSLANEPAFADMCFVEVMAAGPRALERRDGVMRWFADLVDAGAQATLPKKRRPPALAAEALVGGLNEIIFARVLRGEVADLPGLAPEMARCALAPYVG